jgi:hypothetical protein
MCVCVEESRRKQTIGALLWDYYLEELCDLKSTGESGRKLWVRKPQKRTGKLTK